VDRAGPRGDPGIDGTRIGLFGGSFDPPHLGHLELARVALDRLPLARLWVIPAGRPVHRRLSGCASAEQRLDWLTRMFEHWPAVNVLDWEVRADHPVPTIETLRRVHAAQPDTSPVLLLGADAFAGMRDWVDYPAHARLCDVAVFARAGVASARLPEWREVPAAELAQPGAGRVTFVDAELPDVSATGLRERAARGESLSGLAPECVREDIERAYMTGPGRADND
jgi:nicotinate-nucleotide adenylyltransferase